MHGVLPEFQMDTNFKAALKHSHVQTLRSANEKHWSVVNVPVNDDGWRAKVPGLRVRDLEREKANERERERD